MYSRNLPPRWYRSLGIVLMMLLVFFFGNPGNAQTNIYMELIKEGDIQYKANNYIKAFELFIKAKEKAVNTTQSNTAEARAEQSRKAIIQQQADLQKALEETQKALNKAEKLQRKMEVAIFDKAIAALIDDWPDFDSLTAARKLEKVKKLDLANNALTRVPLDVLKCPNCIWIDLSGNPDINWDESAPTLSLLPIDTKISVTVKNLSDIDSIFWPRIISLELRDQTDTIIPESVFRQKQLTGLTISRKTIKFGDAFTNLQGLSNLTNLETLILDRCNIGQIPNSIWNLSLLKSLNLTNNYISRIPSEIGKLKNLTVLNLKGNPLTYLPKEIGSLQNLMVLDLYGEYRSFVDSDGFLHDEQTNGQLRKLPNEMENLKELRYLLLYGTETQFPVWITNLTHIKQFTITASEIVEVPDFLFNTTFPAEWFNSAEWFNDLGQHLLEKENFAQAMKSFRKSLAIDSSDRRIPRSNPWLRKSLAYLDEMELRAGPQQIINGVGSIHGIADIYFRLGIYDSALIWHKKLCQNNEENFNCMYTGLRDCYFKLHQYHEAYLASGSIITSKGLFGWDFIIHSQYCLADKKPLEAIEAAKNGIQMLIEESEIYQQTLGYYDYRSYIYLSLAYLLSGDNDMALQTYKIWHQKVGEITTWREYKEEYLPILLFLEEAGYDRSEFKIIHDFNYEWWGGTIDD